MICLCYSLCMSISKSLLTKLITLHAPLSVLLNFKRPPQPLDSHQCLPIRQLKWDRTIQSKQEHLILETLKWRLEDKTNNYGLWVFNCEILPEVLVSMDHMTPDPSELQPEEARQAMKAKQQFAWKIKLLENKMQSNTIHHTLTHYQTHTLSTT